MYRRIAAMLVVLAIAALAAGCTPDTRISGPTGTAAKGAASTSAPGVPDVVGTSRSDAIGILEGAGFKVQVRNKADAANNGKVVSQKTAAGEKLPLGNTVTIVVGYNPSFPSVPDVVGLEYKDAEARLVAADLKYSLHTGGLSLSSAKVSKQVPQAGDTVEHGTVVDLYFEAK